MPPDAISSSPSSRPPSPTFGEHASTIDRSPSPIPPSSSKKKCPTQHKGKCSDCGTTIKEHVKVHHLSADEFFTNPYGLLQSGAQKAEIRDKSIKFLVYLGEALNGWFKVMPGMPDDFKKDFHTMVDYMKVARTVYAIWNIFAGSINGIYWGIVNMYRLATQDGPVATYNVPLREERTHVGTAEKILAFIAELGYWIGASTYTFAFAICSPINFASKCFKDRVSEGAKSVGTSMPLIMSFNHIGVAVAAICDLIRERLVLDRIMASDEKYDEKVKQTNKFYSDRLPRTLFNLAEKVCEIGVDVVTVFKVQAPLSVKLVINTIGAGFGFYRVWREVEGRAVEDPEINRMAKEGYAPAHVAGMRDAAAGYAGAIGA